MNTVNDRGFRGIAIAALLILGVASTIATGGGGSGGGSLVDPVAPPVTLGPSLEITVANGFDVSSTVVIAIGISLDLGDLTGEGLPVMAAGNTVAATDHKGTANFYAKLLRRDQEAIEGCAITGTVDITMTVADPNTLTVGDRIVALFSDCDDGDGYVINGTVDLTVAEIQGDIFTDVFLVGMEIMLIDVAIADESDTVTADGDFTLTLDSLGYPVLVLGLAGNELDLGSAGEAVTLTDFDHFFELDMSVIPATILAGAEGRLESQTLGGTVDYETPVPVQASGNTDPSSGEILITGGNDSTVRIVIVDSTHVTLEIDENGDGVIDSYVDTTWAALNGVVSSVNASTAAVLAREVYNAVSGFGSVTATAGAQFVPLGPFGQLEWLGVAGEFGPLMVGCESGGTAHVSGSKFTPMTFTSADQLDGTFMACAGRGEILDGDMSFTVDSFDEKPGDAYAVTGTVTQADFRRTIDGHCFSGNGTFDTSHDFAFTTAGVAEASSSTASFAVFAAGREQQLDGATVTSRITFGQPPVTVTQTSSGSITSEDLDGSYSYQSISPDVFLLDDDPETGPYSGELLVTASDGSTMRMVAVDDSHLVLELDFDGDSTVDDVIETTWPTLSYPSWVCDNPW